MSVSFLLFKQASKESEYITSAKSYKVRALCLGGTNHMFLQVTLHMTNDLGCHYLAFVPGIKRQVNVRHLACSLVCILGTG